MKPGEDRDPLIYGSKSFNCFCIKISCQVPRFCGSPADMNDINTAWLKKIYSISYVYNFWTIHGMWMSYITFERGGPKFSNITARALAYRTTVQQRQLRSKWLLSSTRFCLYTDSLFVELVIQTTNALAHRRSNVETKTKRTLYSSRRLSSNELTNAKNLVLYSSHFALNWRCCTAVR